LVRLEGQGGNTSQDLCAGHRKLLTARARQARSVLKPERKDNGTGALQCVVVDGDDRSGTELCSQRSYRLIVGAREPEGSPPAASRRAIADPMLPVPTIAVVMTEVPE